MFKPFKVGVRLWIEDEEEGRTILGPGRLKLLETIDRCHSISAAARELGMSYRRAWLLVESVNRAAGQALVRRQTGGRDGGGAELTRLGRKTMAVYRQLLEQVLRSAAVPPLHVPPSDSVGVHVAAAASLENVLRRLLADFALQQPTLAVRTICGASDELANHVLSGMHVDLFLSADVRQLERLRTAGLVSPDAPIPLAANRLAAIASPSRSMSLRGPRALLQPAIKRIALADPSCPLGHYARCYLEPLGLWESVRQRALFLDNPRGVLAAVESGQAEAGLVYRSDALAAAGCRILFSARSTPSPICYSAALTRSGEQSPGARGLLAFLTSPTAARRFRGGGFLPIGPARRG